MNSFVPAVDPIQFVQRLIAGQPLPCDLHVLAIGVKTWVDTSIPLERCLHLPTTRAKLRGLARNRWLCEAWQAIPGDLTPWMRAVTLAAEVRHFQASIWPSWRIYGKPADASQLRSALYEARLAAGKALPQTAVRLQQICECQ